MPIVFRVHRFTNQGSSLVCGNENDVVRIVKCFVCDFVIVFLATEVDAFLRERVNTVSCTCPIVFLFCSRFNRFYCSICREKCFLSLW